MRVSIGHFNRVSKRIHVGNFTIETGRQFEPAYLVLRHRDPILQSDSQRLHQRGQPESIRQQTRL